MIVDVIHKITYRWWWWWV